MTSHQDFDCLSEFDFDEQDSKTITIILSDEVVELMVLDRDIVRVMVSILSFLLQGSLDETTPGCLFAPKPPSFFCIGGFRPYSHIHSEYQNEPSDVWIIGPRSIYDGFFKRGSDL